MPKYGFLKRDPRMCLVHGGQHYWGNGFNRHPSPGDSVEGLALQFVKSTLVFCGEDAYGCLKHGAKVLHRGFMLNRNA